MLTSDLKTFTRSYSLKKTTAFQLYLKETPAELFFHHFCKVFQKCFLIEHLAATVDLIFPRRGKCLLKYLIKHPLKLYIYQCDYFYSYTMTPELRGTSFYIKNVFQRDMDILDMEITLTAELIKVVMR